MIRCNLAVILAEKNLKISRVSHDTKISRTTLTALTQNNCKGLQLDTINTLCRYLQIEPKDLLIYFPLDIENMEFIIDGDISEFIEFKGVLQFDLIANKQKYFVGILTYCDIESICLDKNEWYHEYNIEMLCLTDDTDEEILEIIKHIPRAFLSDVERQIFGIFYDFCYATKGTKENTTFSISWGKMFNQKRGE